MNLAVAPLGATARPALAAHFLALPPDDLRLRFGHAPTAQRLADYVDAIAFERDVMLAVRDGVHELVGVAHVAFGPDRAELGLSVLPRHRRRGIGGALFERAAVLAQDRLASRLYMHCLVGNIPIMRIARRFGMRIVTDTGDADAYLALPSAPRPSGRGAGHDAPFAFPS